MSEINQSNATASIGGLNAMASNYGLNIGVNANLWNMTQALHQAYAARETALRMALSYGAGHGYAEDDIVRIARVFHAFLSGDGAGA